MTNRVSKPWTVLRDGDGECAIVVPAEDTSVVEALVTAVGEVHGGEFAHDNPVIVEAAKDLKVECWHSCSKAWKEANNVDDLDTDWWAPDGDGRRSVYVVDIEQSLYDIGDSAEAWVEAELLDA